MLVITICSVQIQMLNIRHVLLLSMVNLYWRVC